MGRFSKKIIVAFSGNIKISTLSLKHTSILDTSRLVVPTFEESAEKTEVIFSYSKIPVIVIVLEFTKLSTNKNILH